MKKKFLAFLCLLFSVCAVLSGCGALAPGSEKPTYSYAMNFLKDDFEEEYSRYEKKLNVEEGSSEILISGHTDSGKIDITLINGDGDEAVSYDYTVDGTLDEKISLERGSSADWSAIVVLYEDTEGGFEISVK